MKEKERLLRTILGEVVDRPPWICPGGMMNLVTLDMMDAADAYWPEAHSSPEKMARLAAIAYKTGCFENCGLPFCMTVEVEGMGAKVDMGSRVCEPHVAEYPLRSVTEWQALSKLDWEAGRTRTVLDAIRLLKREDMSAPIIGNLTGPVSAASSLLEPTVYYKELRKNGKEAHALMDFVTRQIIAFGLRQLEAGADIITISDPGASGEILGPSFFEEYAVPCLNRVVSELKEEFPTCGVIVHICGKMHSVYPQLNALHCSALSFDAVVNLRKAREQLPGKFLMGNLSTYTLEFADAAKVTDMARNCLESEVNILAPACGLGSGTPMRNLQTVLRVAETKCTEQERVK